jgi:hypothetical protein
MNKKATAAMLPLPSCLQLLALHKKEEANVVYGAALQRCVSCAAQLHKQNKHKKKNAYLGREWVRL